jgi:hypothetical protein
MFYHRSFQPPGQPLQWEIRTRKYQAYAAGGRDEGRLPDPLGYLTVGSDDKDIFVPDCTYRTLAENLGILQPSEVAMPIVEPPPVEEPTPEITDPAAAAQVAPPPAVTNGKGAVKRPSAPAQPGRQPSSR